MRKREQSQKTNPEIIILPPNQEVSWGGKPNVAKATTTTTKISQASKAHTKEQEEQQPEAIRRKRV